MSIETLIEFPLLAHDEELGAYAYPQEFRNKPFIYQDQFIYIKTSAYDTFPKNILDTIKENIIDEVLSAITDNTTNISENSEVIKKLTEENKKYKEELERYEIRLSALNDAVNNMNDEIENILSKANKDDSVQLENLQLQITELAKSVNKNSNLISEKSEPIDLELTIQEKFKILYDNMFAELSQQIDNKFNDYSAKIIDSKPIKDIVSVSPAVKPNNPNKLITTTNLVMLKDIGFTIEEILELHKNGVI